jgi:aconitate decarboxylase
VARDASFAQLDEDFIRSPLVQHLIGATELRLREEKSAEDPVFSPSDRVVVTLRDGRVFDSGEVAYASGHAKAPLPAGARREKFLQCAAAGGYERAEALFDTIEGLASLADVRELAKVPSRPQLSSRP